ncbi:hypothetical protein [Mesosutterella multiformis]|uniref:hypothetical protein n=1 Tax=Mesosutterella multiformis TaxID=2259133 RepID=UPI000FFA5D3C|nr:hypothetical protein [Mesosutterella multiformis]GCB31160.1 hypothetical protein KGMB02707_04290 [Mesosutterella multiformis]
MTEQKPYARRQAVALAVAAALLAASGAAAAADPVTYDRITTSINEPDQDAVVTYTDDTDETIVRKAPVVPGDDVDPSAGITLTLKSLTVSNTTTAGYTGSAERNGDAIITGITQGTSEWKDPTTGGVPSRCQAMCLLQPEPTRFRRPLITISTVRSAAI